ncbi:MAG: sigma 54-interacting transcriptional regulator [Actinomycetota bacterium]|nr:sigma 54-interacting transcriptional regulator [Actinomycetota bacterium]
MWRRSLDLISQPLPLGAGLARMAAIVAEYMSVDRCYVLLLDRATDELVLQMDGQSTTTEAGAEIRLRVGVGLTGLAASRQRTIQVPHMRRDPRSVDLGDGVDFRSIIAVPIVEEGDLIGVFSLQTLAERHFTPDEVAFLESTIRPLLTLMVTTSHARDDLARRNSQIQALNELGQAMNSGLDLDESLELIAARAAEALGAKGSAIRLSVADGSLALATLYSQTNEGIDSTYEKRIAECVAATGEPILIDEEPHALGSSLLCVPLVLEESVVGTLTLLDKIARDRHDRRRFTDDDLSTLFALSSQIAAEIEDIRLTKRLQELVRTEQKQGKQLRTLYNRSRAFLESISDGLLAVDDNGIVIEVNSVARRIIGRDVKDIEGHGIAELVEDKPPIVSWVSRGEQFSSRVITLKTSEGRVAARANLQPFHDEKSGPAGAVLTFREMAEVGRLVNRVIGVERTFTFDDILGESPAIQQSTELARVAAGTASNILIGGETGTGKEVFAQSIHNASAFAEGPFLAVNCAALPRDLIESELFGYVEGAFTGASRKGRLGKFELASGGSLFLDEIGEIPPEVQVKLLRVLQEKAIVRVGGDRTIPVNCRLIAATNRDLHRAVAEGGFRQDLLYRLDVISIDLPPVRQRLGDLPLFIERFIRIHAERNQKVVEGIEADALSRLTDYHWPGNVREVENVIEHAVALARGRLIGIADLPASMSRAALAPASGSGHSGLTGARLEYEAAKEQMYLEALREAAGDVPKAAELLGVSRATMYRHLRKHGLAGQISKVRYEAQN